MEFKDFSRTSPKIQGLFKTVRTLDNIGVRQTAAIKVILHSQCLFDVLSKFGKILFLEISTFISVCRLNNPDVSIQLKTP